MGIVRRENTKGKEDFISLKMTGTWDGGHKTGSRER